MGHIPRQPIGALSSLLFAHGMICNGGIAHCIDVLTSEEIHRELEDRYASSVPDDEVLAARFGEFLDMSPEDFAPSPEAQ